MSIHTIFRRKVYLRGARAMSNNATVRSTAASGSQVYESKRAVDEYLLFHYGSSADIMPHSIDIDFALNFAQRSQKIVDQLATKEGTSKSRVLDVGCAVGGLSFELARSFNEVVGIDFSHHFVSAAESMKTSGRASYSALVQGEIFEEKEAVVAADIDRSRVSFAQGDACNLHSSLGKFDVIVASNLLCRLPEPAKFLADAPLFLKPGGLLVLISPYSWLDEYTSRANWIGAKPGKESFSEVQAALTSGKNGALTLVHKENIPFLIREHERKFQLGVSDLTAWKLSV